MRFITAATKFGSRLKSGFCRMKSPWPVIPDWTVPSASRNFKPDVLPPAGIAIAVLANF